MAAVPSQQTHCSVLRYDMLLHTRELPSWQRRLCLYWQGYVNGEWVGAKDNKVFSVLNPATKEEIARVADMGADDTKAAIRAANEAWAPWRRRAPKVCF